MHRNKRSENIVPRMDAKTILESLGRLFYFVDPSKTSFETVAQVPHYIGSVSQFRHLNLSTVLYIELKPVGRMCNE